MKQPIAALFAVAVALVLPVCAASAVSTFYGCLECERTTFLGLWVESCVQVGDNETGEIRCDHANFGGRLCITSGGACFNVTVCPDGNCGPGWGGGGGGGDECTVSPGDFCPPSCPTCSYYYVEESPEPVSSATP